MSQFQQHTPSAYYTSIESSKGIYSTYMCMENYTINIVCSDYLSISALNKYSKNVNLADLIAILGSIDFVLGSVDTKFRGWCLFERAIASGLLFC